MEPVQNTPAILSTAKLAEALSKAQAEMKAPLKKCKVDFTDKQGRRVKYNYADLADLIEAVKEPLSKNSLAVSHRIEVVKGGLDLVTLLLHASGESLSSNYPLPDPTQIKPQEFGSAITYARRYSLSCLVGIASDEDDDGSSATPPSKPQEQKAKVPISPKNYAPGASDPLDAALKAPPKLPKPKSEGPSEAQLKRLYAIGQAMGWNSHAIRLYSVAHVNRTPGKLSPSQYDQLCTFIDGTPFDNDMEDQIVELQRKLTPEQLEMLE